jgi:hypothetical protein
VFVPPVPQTEIGEKIALLSTLIRNYGDVFLTAVSGRGGKAFATNFGQEGLKVAPCEPPLER